MVKRIVDTNFWTSRQVIDTYSVEDKFFALYLMTNDMSSQVGIYSLPKKIISFEIGFTTEVIQVLIDRFSEKYGEVIYSERTQEVTLLNSLSYSILTGGAPVKKLLRRELREVEEGSLILATYHAMFDFWKGSVRKFDQEVKAIFEKELTTRGLMDLHNQKTESESLVTHSAIKYIDEMSQKEIIAIERYIDYLKQKKPSFSGVPKESEILCVFYEELLGEVTMDVQDKFSEWEGKLPKSIILEALVRSEGKIKPISYADTVITNWLDQGVKSKVDIAQLDRAYSREHLKGE